MNQVISHKAIVFSFLPLSLSLFLVSCGSSTGSSSGGTAGENVPVTLRFRLPGTGKASLRTISAPSPVSSIQMTVRGPGMTTISDTFSISPGENVSRTFSVLPGPGRIFGGTIFDVAGVALFEGETSPINILPASKPKITLALQALFDDAPTPPLLNLFSELPLFSADYVLNDAPGTLPFVGLSVSTRYLTRVGVTAVTGRKSTSPDYTLQ